MDEGVVYNLMNVPSSAVTISPILVLTYVLIVFVKRTNGIIQSLKQQCGHGDYSPVDDFSSNLSLLKLGVQLVAGDDHHDYLFHS